MYFSIDKIQIQIILGSCGNREMIGYSRMNAARRRWLCILSRHRYLKKLHLLSSGERSDADEAQRVCWIPPTMNVYKANFDASWWEDGRATLACVVRNHSGTLLLVAGWECHCASAEAELIAAWQTTGLWKDRFSGKKLWIEWDALSIIQALNSHSDSSEPSVLLNTCAVCFKAWLSTGFPMLLKQGNQCVNWVTKWIRECGHDVLLVTGFPSKLYSIAQADAFGASFERN